IDDRYVEEAKSIFRKIINTDNSATYYQVAVAAMLYVILAHNLPVSTKLVINACRSRGHKLTFESIRDSLMAMGIKYSVRDRILSHIRVGLGKLFGDSWVTIYPYAEEALGKLRKSTIQSRSPLTLAAAIVYCVGKRYSHNLKIEDVARVMQVSPYTLRGYVNNLCKDITK
ncbi:MAG: cyclin family protein, partial [Vulcanisaeta sp.]